jgi:hypothetical protein
VAVTRWQELDVYLDARGIHRGPARIGQTTGGAHAAGSYHYAGLARDYGDVDGPIRPIFDALLPLATRTDYALVELFGPWGLYKRGRQITDAALARQHRDHVHAAINPGAPPLSSIGGHRVAVTANLPVLRTGATGKHVEALQALLRVKAGQGVALDGNFGPGTDRAVRNVQAFFSLTVDGIVGAGTWKTLLEIP